MDQVLGAAGRGRGGTPRKRAGLHGALLLPSLTPKDKREKNERRQKRRKDVMGCGRESGLRYKKRHLRGRPA